MMVELAQSASRRWRRLNSHHQIALILEGRISTDVVLQNVAGFSSAEHIFSRLLISQFIGASVLAPKQVSAFG